MAHSANLTERLARLREDYLARLPAELATVTALADALQTVPPDAAILKELHFRLHSLVGSSGTFALGALSREARRLEQQAKVWLDAPPASTAELQTFVAAVRQLPARLDAAAPEQTP